MHDTDVPRGHYRVMHKCVSVVLVAAHELSNQWRWFCLFGCLLKLQHVEPSQPFISLSLHFIGWLMKTQYRKSIWNHGFYCACVSTILKYRGALALQHLCCHTDAVFLNSKCLFVLYLRVFLNYSELSFLTTTKQQCKTFPLVFEIVQVWASRTLDIDFCGSVTNRQWIKHTFSLCYILEQEPAKRELPSPKRNSCNKMMTLEWSKLKFSWNVLSNNLSNGCWTSS